MKSSDRWVLDASVLINILATGEAHELLGILPYECLVERHAFYEVRRDPSGNLPSPVPLESLLTAGLLSKSNMTNQELDLFLYLAAEKDLGDGESGAIALGYCRQLIIATDDVKALRVGNEVGGLTFKGSIDIFRAAEESRLVDSTELQKWIDRALVIGRMRVADSDLPWLVTLLGEEKCSGYPSLRRAMRHKSESLICSTVSHSFVTGDQTDLNPEKGQLKIDLEDHRSITSFSPEFLT